MIKVQRYLPRLCRDKTVIYKRMGVQGLAGPTGWTPLTGAGTEAGRLDLSL